MVCGFGIWQRCTPECHNGIAYEFVHCTAAFQNYISHIGEINIEKFDKDEEDAVRKEFIATVKGQLGETNRMSERYLSAKGKILKDNEEQFTIWKRKQELNLKNQQLSAQQIAVAAGQYEEQQKVKGSDYNYQRLLGQIAQLNKYNQLIGQGAIGASGGSPLSVYIPTPQ